MTIQLAHLGLGFVCPRCKGHLRDTGMSFSCLSCGRTYPVLFGIPDFRLRPDRYLSLSQERAKAAALHEYGRHVSFDALIDYYYSITDDVPPDLARIFGDYIRNASARARPVLQDLRPRPETDILLDVGCGTGGLLVEAAAHYRAVIGVDLALRWLVICQKRLRENGVTACLVCADVEALPFPPGRVSHVVAADLVEHVYDVGGTVAAIAGHLRPGGLAWISAANRFCPGPHPSSRVWAIGLLPRPLRRWTLLRLKGVDLLRNVNMVSPGGLVRHVHQCGLTLVSQRPKAVAADHGVRLTPLQRGLVAAYCAALRWRMLRGLLLRAGPAFEIICRKPVRAIAGHAGEGRWRCGSG